MLDFKDKRKISTKGYTDNGYLLIDAIGTNEGIQQYSGKSLGYTDQRATQVFNVYRPQSVFDNADTRKSAEFKDLTIGHPDTVNSTNYKDLSVGQIRKMKGNVISLIVKDKDTIRAIEDGEITETSFGYTARIIEEKGVFDGTEYTHKFDSNMIINHSALLGTGESRTNAPILDDNTTIIKELNNMKLIEKDGKFVVTSDDNATIATFDDKQQAEVYMTDAKEKEAKSDAKGEEKPAEEQKKETKDAETEETPAEKKDASEEKPADTESTVSDSDLELIADKLAKRLGLDKETTQNDAKDGVHPDDNYIVDSRMLANAQAHRLMDSDDVAELFTVNNLKQYDDKGQELRNLAKGREKELADIADAPWRGRDVYGKNWYDYDHLVTMHDKGILHIHNAMHFQNLQTNETKALMDGVRRQLTMTNNIHDSFKVGNEVVDLTDALTTFAISNKASINSFMYEQFSRSIPVNNYISQEPNSKTNGDVADEFVYRTLLTNFTWHYIDEFGKSSKSGSMNIKKTSVTAEWSGADVVITDRMMRDAVFAGIPIQSKVLIGQVQAFNKFLEQEVILGDDGWIQYTGIKTVTKPKWDISTDAGRQAVLDTLGDALETLMTETTEAIADPMFYAGLPQDYNAAVIAVLPRPLYKMITETPANVSNGNMNGLSILDWFIRHNYIAGKLPVPFIVTYLSELDGAGTAGADRIRVGVRHAGVFSYGVPVEPKLTRVVQKERNAVMVFDGRTAPPYLKLKETQLNIDVAK